jgi:biopolymer transport protein ExbD
MRIRDPESDIEEPINLLNLIDTLFFLLMFFLIATRFKEEERDVGIQLPQLASSQPLSALPQQIIINIREDGTTVIAGKTYDPDQLMDLLSQSAAAGNRDVLIRADERSLHRYFANVAGLCRKAGIGEVKIGYLLEEPKPVPVQ